MTLNSQGVTGTAETIVDALGQFTIDAKDKIHSILRIVGQFQYRINAVNAEIGGRFGFIVVSDDALAANAVPDPATDSESDWMLNMVYYADDSTLRMHQIDFDNRSARRLPGGEHTLAFVIEGNIATNTVNWGIGARILFSYK